MPTAKKPTSNNLAFASVTLGILSLIGLTVFAGIPAIITGIMALNQSQNKSMSIAGIVMGSISVVVALVVVLIAALLIGLLMTLPLDQYPAGELPGGESPNGSYQQRA